MKRLVYALPLLAAGTMLGADPDASGIITTATTTFQAVGTLVVSTVGFFVTVKMVKWIRK